MFNIHGTGDPPSARTVRDGAVAMLAAGNAIETVANFFGVPVDTVRTLVAQPREALPVDAPSPVQPWHHFPGPVVYRCPDYAVLAMLAIAQVAVAAVGWVLFSAPRYTGPMFISVWLLFAIGYAVALAQAIHTARMTKFVMGRDAIAGYTVNGRSVVPYAEIVSYVKEVKNGEYTIHLLARNRVALSVVASVGQVQEARLAAWLKTVPGTDNTLIDPIPNKFFTWLPGLFIASFILLLPGRTGIDAVLDAHEAKLSLQWPATDGVVTESSTLTGGKGCRHILRIHYTYPVAGNLYTGSIYQFGKVCAEDVLQIAAANPPGKHIRVHYRSERPAESVIVPGLISTDMAIDMFEMLVMMMFPAFFFRYNKEK